jgi:UDP:flavonoid glycosyltransferase YjiC (YdhE family)
VSSKKTILFAPAAYNLAETTRMIEIAKAVAAHDRAKLVFEIQFVSEGGQFEGLIESEGFNLIRTTPRLDEEKIAYIMAVDRGEKLAAAFTKQELIEKIESDINCLKEIKPVVVVTGSHTSMPASTQVASIPIVWVIQSTWLKSFFKSGAGITDNLRPRLFKLVADQAIFLLIWFWLWFGIIRNVNAAARHFGARGFKSVFDYFKGNLTLVAEPPEFTNAQMPPNHVFVGPIIAKQDFPVPDAIQKIPKDKPLIYFAMGSSGASEIVAELIKSFRGKPYYVIAPVKALLKTRPDLLVPENVIVTDWLPALEVNKLADLSLIHGGIGTVMTAAIAGKPVVGVGMQPEQVANLSCLVRRGIAVRIPKGRHLAPKVQAAINKQLQNESAKRNAEAFSKLIQQWNGPQLAAEALYDNYGR